MSTKKKAKKTKSEKQYLVLFKTEEDGLGSHHRCDEPVGEQEALQILEELAEEGHDGDEDILVYEVKPVKFKLEVGLPTYNARLL